jgi:SulP family sulfate permease
MSGVVCSLMLGLVALAHFDLPGVIPVPIVAGLVLYLGYNFVVDAFARPYAQRAWLDLALALVIMLVCVRFGYLVGVLAGLVGACVHFALNYARVGVVRRQATRAMLASHVDRTAVAMQHLHDAGESIRIYWLSGYIFFGSSEGVFERIRNDIEAQRRPRVRFVILECAQVPGMDASAIGSLTKLRNFCSQRRVVLAYSGLRGPTHDALRRGGCFGGRTPHVALADLDAALAWCEDGLLAEAGLDARDGADGFERWLQGQLGEAADARDLLPYLERRDTADGEVLYREGEPANTVDLVAAGTLCVDLAQDDGSRVRVRRITTHTVLGEMGFVRRASRSATVCSEGPATVYTLHRHGFERMRREHPALASAFDDFLLRVLAERMVAANRALAALHR